MLYFEIHFDQGFSGSTRQGTREWPPSPSRVFSALVAGSVRAGGIAHDALRQLEKTPPPTIATSTAHLPENETLQLYVPTKSSVPPSSSSKPPIKVVKDSVSELRMGVKERLPLIAERVVYSVDAPEELSSILDQAAAEISYIGTSTDTATVRVTTDEPEHLDVLERWIPLSNPTGASGSWREGYLDALELRHTQLQAGALYSPHAFAAPLTYVRGTAPTPDADQNNWIPLVFERMKNDSSQIQPWQQRVSVAAGTDPVDVIPLVFGDRVHGRGQLFGFAVRGLTAVQSVISEADLGLFYNAYDQRVWASLVPYFTPSTRWRSVVPIYAPRDFPLACDYLDLLAEQAGLTISSVMRTTLDDTGSAPKSMPHHPLGYVPYSITAESAFATVCPRVDGVSLASL